MKKLSRWVLWFMAVFWLTGCVLTINNNWGSNIHTDKIVDDIGIGQEYDAQVEKAKK